MYGNAQRLDLEAFPSGTEQIVFELCITVGANAAASCLGGTKELGVAITIAYGVGPNSDVADTLSQQEPYYGLYQVHSLTSPHPHPHPPPHCPRPSAAHRLRTLVRACVRASPTHRHSSIRRTAHFLSFSPPFPPRPLCLGLSLPTADCNSNYGLADTPVSVHPSLPLPSRAGSLSPTPNLLALSLTMPLSPLSSYSVRSLHTLSVMTISLSPTWAGL